MNFRKATLGELQDILRDENAGAGAKHLAYKELKRRESGAFRNTPPPMIRSDVLKWAREKSGISIENNFRVGKLK
jgi:hypothetical protein